MVSSYTGSKKSIVEENFHKPDFINLKKNAALKE